MRHRRRGNGHLRRRLRVRRSLRRGPRARRVLRLRPPPAVRCGPLRQPPDRHTERPRRPPAAAGSTERRRLVVRPRRRRHRAAALLRRRREPRGRGGCRRDRDGVRGVPGRRRGRRDGAVAPRLRARVPRALRRRVAAPATDVPRVPGDVPLIRHRRHLHAAPRPLVLKIRPCRFK